MNDRSFEILTVAEAAGRLDLSEVRVRTLLQTGALGGARDNQGRWMVHLPPGGPPISAGVDTHVEADDAIEILLDQIVEMREADRLHSNELARQTALIERQQVALDRALALLEDANSRTKRLEITVERAHTVAERGLHQLETAVAELKASEKRSLRTADILGRAVDLIAKLGRRQRTRATAASADRH